MNFALTSEAITGLYNKTITRSYEITEMIGRYKGFNVKNLPVDAIHYSVDYSYDSHGRFNQLTDGADTFNYSYLANSNLIESVNYPHNISVTKSYESNRNLITSVINSVGFVPSVVSQYDYTNDAIGRRTAMAKSGTAFVSNDIIDFSYNDRSEVTCAVSQNDTLWNYSYAFDNIGNRETSITNESGSAVTSNYTSNNLNQYTNITNPNQSPLYDLDGNMIQCNLGILPENYTLTYNAENRLIIAESTTAKLEFAYDYMGRRVEKKVYSGSAGAWTLDKHLKFIYDNYKLIEELDGLDSDTIVKKYIWNGEEPFSMTDADGTFYYLLDANKNISELIDNTGVIKAHYEYSPFGKITKQSGDKADDNPIRFSSEYFDKETELIYYNYRYYSPELGRWLNRDPIEENGGENLYHFVFNNGINFFDFIGLWTQDEVEKIICCENSGGEDKIAGLMSVKTFTKAIIKYKDKNGKVTSTEDITESLRGLYRGGAQVLINAGLSNEEAASTLFHEATHMNQSSFDDPYDREYDAHTQQAQFEKHVNSHCRPGAYPDANRFDDSDGNIDPKNVKKHVDETYKNLENGDITVSGGSTISGWSCEGAY